MRPRGRNGAQPPSRALSQVITQEVVVGMNLESGVPRKPPGFWMRDDVKEVVRAVKDGELKVRDAAEHLDVTEQKVLHFVNLMRKQRLIYDPARKDLQARAAKRTDDTPRVNFADLKQAINWAEFFQLGQPSYFDLRVVCATFYASEYIINVAKTANKKNAEFNAIVPRCDAYVKTWAERFGKYTLAACLGEFRHRRVAGDMKLVPQGANRGSRAAAQRAAMLLWPNPKHVQKASAYLVEKFADRTFFPGTSLGGPRWAKIAKTFYAWFSKEIPDAVFVDYVWDLSHNGGRFFDKCELFQNEHLVRRILTQKSQAKDRADVLDWGRDFLHPDWVRGIELAKIASMPAPEVTYGGEA